MTRTKQRAGEGKAKKPMLKKTIAKTEITKDKDKTKRQGKRSVNWYTCVKRLCEDAKIQNVSQDALATVIANFEYNIRQHLIYLQQLMKNKSKMVSEQSIRNSFIGYFEKQNVNPQLILGAVQAGEAAVQKLKDSENKKKN